VVGYRGTTTRQIAAAAGIRQPSLFHHFPSKQAVLEELLAYDLDATVAYSRALAGASGSAAVRLYRYIWWDVTCCIESPYDLRGLSAGSVLQDPVFEKWRRDKEELHANIAAMIEQGVGAGEFVACDVHVAREVVTALSTETIRLQDVLPRSAHDTRPHAAASFVVRALMADPAQLDAVRAEAVDADLTDWPLLGPR
jgi:AcrR family transcriptional regulator